MGLRRRRHPRRAGLARPAGPGLDWLVAAAAAAALGLALGYSLGPAPRHLPTVSYQSPPAS